MDDSLFQAKAEKNILGYYCHAFKFGLYSSELIQTN